MLKTRWRGRPSSRAAEGASETAGRGGSSDEKDARLITQEMPCSPLIHGPKEQTVISFFLCSANDLAAVESSR